MWKFIKKLVKKKDSKIEEINRVLNVLLSYNLHRFVMQILSKEYCRKVDYDQKKESLVVNATPSIHNCTDEFLLEEVKDLILEFKTPIIMAMFNESILLQMYDVAFEINFYFIEDLCDQSYHPSFDSFIE